MDEAFACESLSCPALADHTVDWCEKEHCPFVHQRRRVQDRELRHHKDRLEMQSGIQPPDPFKED